MADGSGVRSDPTSQVWIDAGSRYETERTNGTAHFLEHMAFKGTARMGARELEETVEGMGAHLNAYTSREQTTYYAKCAGGESVGKCVGLLADILQRPALDAAAVERERGVILREMQEVEGQPEEVLFDHLHATAFQRTSLGRPILGPAENVRSITRDDLQDYIQSHYTAGRMVVVGAGDIDHKAFVEKVAKEFEDLPKGGSAQGLIQAGPAHFTGSEVRLRDPDAEKVHVAVSVKGVGWNDPDSVPLMVMQHMLGSMDKDSYVGINSGSKLQQRLASNNLCDHFMTFNTHYTDTGIFGMYAVSDAEKMDDLCWTMMHDMTALAYSVTDLEVARAKNQLKSSLLFSADGTSGLAEEMGRQILTYGRHISKEEMYARIDSVDVDAVKGVAGRLIQDNEVAIAAMGDTTSMQDYHWFRRMTYWLTY